MALNQEAPAQDVVETVEPSTSSETNSESVAPEITPEVVEEKTEEKAPVESTETDRKPKPRHRKIDAKIRDLEDRIAVQETVPAPSTEENAPDPRIAASQRLLERRGSAIQEDISDFRHSDDEHERAIAKTMEDFSAKRNSLSDIDITVQQQLVMDGVSAEEFHDLLTHYGDKLEPASPDVEYRRIKRCLRQIRSGNIPNAKKPRATKAAPAPTAKIPGSGGSIHRASTPAAFEKMYRGN